jgi:hypothetical protein
MTEDAKTIMACIALIGIAYAGIFIYTVTRRDKRKAASRQYPSAVDRKLTTQFDDKVIRMYVREDGDLQELDEHENKIS